MKRKRRIDTPDESENQSKGQVTLNRSMQRRGEYEAEMHHILLKRGKKPEWSKHQHISKPATADIKALHSARECAITEGVNTAAPFALIHSVVRSLGERYEQSNSSRSALLDSCGTSLFGWLHATAFELADIMIKRNPPSECMNAGANAALMTSLQAWAPCDVEKRSDSTLDCDKHSSPESNESSQIHHKSKLLHGMTESEMFQRIAKRAARTCSTVFDEEFSSSDVATASSHRRNNHHSSSGRSSGSDGVAHNNSSNTDHAAKSATCSSYGEAAEGALLCFAVYLSTLSEDADARLRLMRERQQAVSMQSTQEVLIPILKASFVSKIVLFRSNAEAPRSILQCMLVLAAQDAPAGATGSSKGGAEERVERARSIAAHEAKRALNLYVETALFMMPFENMTLEQLTYAWLSLPPAEQHRSLNNIGSLELKARLFVSLVQLLSTAGNTSKKKVQEQLCMSAQSAEEAIVGVIDFIGGNNSDAARGATGSLAEGISQQNAGTRPAAHSLQAAATTAAHAVQVYCSLASDGTLHQMALKVEKVRATLEHEQARMGQQESHVDDFVDECLGIIDKLSKMLHQAAQLDAIS